MDGSLQNANGGMLASFPASTASLQSLGEDEESLLLDSNVRSLSPPTIGSVLNACTDVPWNQSVNGRLQPLPRDTSSMQILCTSFSLAFPRPWSIMLGRGGWWL